MAWAGPGSRSIKIIVIGLLLAIVASLTSGLVFLLKDRGSGERVLLALTLRVLLSLGLLGLLALGSITGLWPPPL